MSPGRGEGAPGALRGRGGSREGMSIPLRETGILLLQRAGKALAGVGMLNWSQGRPPEQGQAAEMVLPTRRMGYIHTGGSGAGGCQSSPSAQAGIPCPCTAIEGSCQ